MTRTIQETPATHHDNAKGTRTFAQLASTLGSKHVNIHEKHYIASTTFSLRSMIF
jgi:hypothetical protein